MAKRDIRRALQQGHFIDNDKLYLGSGDDFYFTCDGTSLYLKNSSDKTMFYFTSAGRMRNGSYTTPYAFDAASATNFSLYGLSTTNSGYDSSTFFFVRGTGSSALFGCTALVEGSSTGSSYPKTLQGSQFMALLTAGAKLASRGSDVTAGQYAAWLKVGSPTTATVDSGAYTAAVWLDNQHYSNSFSGTEYTIFSSTGGTVPDAWAGFDTSSAGWAALFLFEDDCAPLTDSSMSLSTQAGALTVVTPSGTRYIPLYSS